MRHHRRPPVGRGEAAGFTLAEAAVTIAIVAIVLLMVVQGLQSATRKAYHTKVQKTAHELAQGLLGEVRCGLYRDEMDSGMGGSFADQDEPAYEWEIVLGDEVFEERDDRDRPFDNFAERRRRDDERDDDSVLQGDDEEDEEATEPFEKIKVKVIYPVLDEEMENELILEAWVPWEELYGPEEEEELGAGSGSGGDSGGGGDR